MKTHPLNVSYLVIGLVYLGLAGSWALHQTGVIAAADVEWLLPLTLVAAGAIGLVAFVGKGLTGGGRSSDSAAEYDQGYGQDYGYDYADTYDYQLAEPVADRTGQPDTQLDTQPDNQPDTQPDTQPDNQQGDTR